MEMVIVTRHAGLVEWLRRRGIEGNVIAHATPADVTGKVVVGVLPMNLAAMTEKVINIDLPGLPAEKRGVDISAEEMDQYGAVMSTYKVEKL